MHAHTLELSGRTYPELLSLVKQSSRSVRIVGNSRELRPPDGFLDGALPNLEGVLRSFDRLSLQDGPLETVPIVKLLIPADHARIARYPRSELEWEAVDSHLSTYLVESQFCQPGRIDWSLSQIKLISPKRGEQMVRVEIPFGVGQQPHRWRIWAISRAGDVSISDWRTIDFTN